MSTTVLVAASEPGTSSLLERQLRDHGFEVVPPGARADVVIAGDGAELERWFGEAAVIVLGGADDDPDAGAQAFERGCDDYVPRPFQSEELVARIRAVLSRPRRQAERTIVAGAVRIDERARVASLRGVPLRLSAKEFRLLATLAAEPMRLFSKGELLRDIWGWPASMQTRTLDSHVCRLRRKLRAVDPASPYVDNEWGVGYRFFGIYAEE